MSYFVTVEAVNLGNFIYDTKDLSTIRGGSILLLRAIGAVERWLKSQGLDPKVVTKGASAGVFELPGLGGFESGERLRERLDAHLAEGAPSGEAPLTGLQHATIAVDVHQNKGTDYPREELLALTRWRQMQSPTLVYPREVGIDYVCDVDEVRPGLHREGIKGTVSTAVRDRRRFGLQQKKTFYEEETGIKLKYDVANEFEEIADDPGKQYGNLGGKIALIYVDGNKFGAIQRKKCGTVPAQQEFDTRLRGYRRGLLTKLLEEAEKKSDWQGRREKERDKGKKETYLRLETLLWGGDEIRWVVPAWMGWATLRMFFGAAAEWEYEGRLTHAGCVIFANHKAPIHQLVAISEELVGMAKDKLEAQQELRDVFVYQVLESFDAIGGDLHTTLKKRYPFLKDPFGDAGKPGRALVLEASALGAAEEIMPQLRMEQGYPRRKLHAVVRELANGRGARATEIADETLARLPEGPVKEAAVKAQTAFGELPWFHLNELWDYVAPLAK